MKTINVAVVGCGYWGPNLARNLAGVDGVRTRLLCDVRAEQAARVAKRHPGAEVTTSVDEVASDSEIDAVVIATPVRHHHAIAKQMLMAGKHVLVEKPLAASSAQCTDLIELASARGLVLMVGHTFLYSPPVNRIKEIVDSGEIGDVLYMSSNRLSLGLFRTDINVLWDLAPHDISIMLYLKESMPNAVNCQGQGHVLAGVEDFTAMSLVFPDGTFATVQSSWLNPRKVRDFTIVGSRKMIFYDDNEPREKIRVYNKRVEVPKTFDTFAEFQQAYHYGDMLVPHLEHDEPLRVECEHFIHCIRTGATPTTDGHNGLQVVRVLEAASQSLQLHGMRVALRTAADPARTLTA
jgi:predicted dehydrogenase